MLELELDVEELARRVGAALAVIHWAAKTDGRDIEFVLGSSTGTRSFAARHKPVDVDNIEPYTYTGPESRAIDDLFCPRTDLWVLDFNQVREITMDDVGVALAVEAVRLNDPYFPKPLRESAAEKRLWGEFVSSYLKKSHDVLVRDGCGEEKALALPRKFILGVTEMERERMQARQGEV